VRPRVGRTTFSYCTNGQGYNTTRPGFSHEGDPPHPTRARAQAQAQAQARH
jgi:hypothetical protein